MDFKAFPKTKTRQVCLMIKNIEKSSQRPDGFVDEKSLDQTKNPSGLYLDGHRRIETEPLEEGLQGLSINKTPQIFPWNKALKNRRKSWELVDYKTFP